MQTDLPSVGISAVDDFLGAASAMFLLSSNGEYLGDGKGEESAGLRFVSRLGGLL